MANRSDYELINEIQAGHDHALGMLFDRYGLPLYEFIYLVTGDRDQAALLLEELFARVPSRASPVSGGESIRGWLYGLAREASLTFLRQKNWLNALPPSEDADLTGLAADVWHAARAMPAFHRAALVLEELHGLSPMEKARALNVIRTDLPRVMEDALRSFNDAYDLQARKEGRPLSASIDPEQLWGMHRRIDTSRTLFGFLPPLGHPQSLVPKIRQKVLASMQVEPPPSAFTETETESEMPPWSSTWMSPEGWNLTFISIAVLVACLIIAISAWVAVSLTRDNTPPVITRIDPPDGAILPPNPHVIITVVFQDDRAADKNSIRLVLDGRDVTSQMLPPSETSITFAADLDSGQHVVFFEVRDTSGNKTSRAWQFTISPAAETTPVATPTASVVRPPTPTVTGTRPPPPTINAFSANQTTITSGTSVLLTWSVTNADSVSLNQEKVDPAGTRLVTPLKTTTFQLLASNAGGTASATVTVVVQELPDLIVTEISLGSANQIIYVVRNEGTADVTRPFLIQVTANNLVVESDRPVSSLPAGQEARLLVPNYVVSSTQTISVRVNLFREVQESNYSNNELSRTLIIPTVTPTRTLTPTNTPTNTPSPTSMPLPTNTPSPTNTPLPTSTPTNTPTNIPTNTPTITPTYTPSLTPTVTKTPTASP